MCKKKKKTNIEEKLKVPEVHMAIGGSDNESLVKAKEEGEGEDDEWDMLKDVNSKEIFDEDMIIIRTKRQCDAIRGLMLC